MCGLSLAWVTSENSTLLLESDILRLFFTGPYLVSSPLCSGVWCWLPLRSSTPTSAVRLSPVQPQLLSRVQPPTSALLPPTASLLSCHQLSLCSPATNSLSLSGSRRQLSFASPYHFQVRRDFRSKNPLSGFAPKQTCLLWRPTPIVLHSATATTSLYSKSFPLLFLLHYGLVRFPVPSNMLNMFARH